MSVKVCHVSSVHPRYDIRIFYKECISLVKAGYDVTLIVADGKPDEVNNSVKIVSVPVVFKSRFKRILRSSKIMYKKAIEIDAEIYHLHDPELLPLASKLKKAGKKVIFDSHEDYVAQIKIKDYIPYILRYLFSEVYKAYETYVSKKIDAVIIPCTFSGGVDIFQNRTKITEVISTTPLLEEFYYRYNEYESKRDFRSVCYVGNLSYARGITNLIKAAYNANVRLILGGKFSPNDYQIKLSEMPEYACVDYRGHLTREEVYKVYEESTIGASIMLNMGEYNKEDILATKVYEYMAMGLPVVISRSHCTDTVLKKYKFGIAVEPGKIEEITNAIKFLIDNPDKAKEMGVNGRCAVYEEYNWGVDEKKLISLYRKLEMSHGVHAV